MALGELRTVWRSTSVNFRRGRGRFPDLMHEVFRSAVLRELSHDLYERPEWRRIVDGLTTPPRGVCAECTRAHMQLLGEACLADPASPVSTHRPP